jgi:hypothetical protein
MDRDQLDYGKSIGSNWKNQMLANIVRLRFVDMPVFVDVGSIVAGYSLETSVSGRVGFGDSLTGGDSQGLGAGGRFTDRPTITYMPKTGDDYLRSILEPVEPRNVLALVQAGYSAKLLYTWSVESINGVQNYSILGANARNADPEFYEFAELSEQLQRMGALGFELESDSATQRDVILTLKKQGVSEEARRISARAADLIGLDQNLGRYRVLYAPFKTGPDTLTMQTRSVIQMLSAMSGFIDIPAELADQTAPGYEIGSGLERPFRVNSGPDRPEDSFAAVKYQDYWFWIDKTDLESKRVFTLMLFLTTLTNQARDDNAPVLTIPTS